METPGGTHQHSVRGAGQFTVVMDSAVEDGSLSRHSLLRVVIYDVPGLHVERPRRSGSLSSVMWFSFILNAKSSFSSDDFLSRETEKRKHLSTLP